MAQERASIKIKLLTWSIRWMMAGREMKLLMQLSTFIVSSFNTRKAQDPYVKRTICMIATVTVTSHS